MNAIRKIVEVKNNSIQVDLPEHLNGEMVEVIVLENAEADYYVSPEEQNLIMERAESATEKDFYKWDDVKSNYVQDQNS